MDTCPFCRIVRGEDAAARVVHRTATWVAFFPLEPATRGHTLVVPVEHIEQFWRASEPVAANLAVGALRVGQALQQVLQPEGMNLISSAGAVAEQTVPHVHLHVVPRWADDRLDAIWPEGQETPSAVLDTLADEVRAAVDH